MLDPVTATIAVIGTAATLQQGRQQRKESRRQSRIAEKRARLENRRQRLAQLRESQIAKAQIVAAGAQAGALGTSAVQGGVASLETQTASNLSFINQIESLQQNIALSQQRASDFRGNIGAISSLTSAATQISQG